MYKPILISTDKSNLIKSGFNSLFITPPMNVKSSDVYMDIILIDTEAEIIEGDVFYNSFNGVIGISQLKKWDKDGISFKVISSTNKSHNLPQLSPQSIQLLINYYNEYKVMPESIDVEEILSKKTICGRCGERIACKSRCMLVVGVPTKDTIKLNSQGEIDITIPEVEESNEDELLLIIKRFKNHAEIHSWPSKSFKEKVTKLLNSKKK